jgi:hypothetical protein
MAKHLKKASRNRGSTKKITRRRRKTAVADIPQGTLVDLDQFYKAVNRVQLSREAFNFSVRESDSVVFENILRDLELPFSKSQTSPSLFEYTVSPGKERLLQQDTEDGDEYPDEIPEDGQVFND